MIQTGSKRNLISISNPMKEHVFDFEWKNWISNGFRFWDEELKILNGFRFWIGFGTIFGGDDHVFDFGTKMKKNE